MCTVYLTIMFTRTINALALVYIYMENKIFYSSKYVESVRENVDEFSTNCYVVIRGRCSRQDAPLLFSTDRLVCEKRVVFDVSTARWLFELSTFTFQRSNAVDRRQ